MVLGGGSFRAPWVSASWLFRSSPPSSTCSQQLMAVIPTPPVRLTWLRMPPPVSCSPRLSRCSSGCTSWVCGRTDLHRDGWRYPGDCRIPGAQLRFTDRDGHRFTCLATNTKRGQLADLELRHSRRNRCEDRIRSAKDTGLANLPPARHPRPPLRTQTPTASLILRKSCSARLTRPASRPSATKRSTSSISRCCSTSAPARSPSPRRTDSSRRFCPQLWMTSSSNATTAGSKAQTRRSHPNDRCSQSPRSTASSTSSNTDTAPSYSSARSPACDGTNSPDSGAATSTSTQAQSKLNTN